MLFKKDDLKELLWGDDLEINGKVAVTVLNEQIYSSRWSSRHVLVFSYDGKFYETTYSRGLTEMQDERPFEYEPEEIECQEVVPVEVTKIEYRPV